MNKYADHLPHYRQSGIFERDRIDFDRSTLADWVGKSAALLEPLADAIGRHVLTGQAIFADGTIWAYGRDKRPWGSGPTRQLVSVLARPQRAAPQGSPRNVSGLDARGSPPQLRAKIRQAQAKPIFNKRVYRIYCELELNLRIKPRKRLNWNKPDALAVPDVT